MSNSLDAPREFPTPSLCVGFDFFSFFESFFFVVCRCCLRNGCVRACARYIVSATGPPFIFLVDCCCSKNFWNKTGSSRWFKILQWQGFSKYEVRTSKIFIIGNSKLLSQIIIVLNFEILKLCYFFFWRIARNRGAFFAAAIYRPLA